MDILVIDVGGSHVKLCARNHAPSRFKSGDQLTAAALVERVRERTRGWQYEVISIGFPGVVCNGAPSAEPGNLGSGWVGFDFEQAFGRPVRLVNDAVMQAVGAYDGGRMLFLGLGTGVGSALIVDHVLVPLELGDLHFEEGSVSEILGRDALERDGKKAWRKAVLALVPPLQKAFLADYVVLGGGNAKHMGKKLPPGVRLGSNLTAFRGGYRLWGIDDVATLKANGKSHGKTRHAPHDASAWRVL